MVSDLATVVKTAAPSVPDDLIPLREIGRTLGSPRMSYATAWRWALRGVNGVILPTLKIGRGRYVRRADLLAFGETLAEKAAEGYAARTPAPAMPAPVSRTRSAARRACDLEAAKNRLRDRGLLK